MLWRLVEKEAGISNFKQVSPLMLVFSFESYGIEYFYDMYDDLL